MSKRLHISVCTYQGGGFDVIFIDPDTNREVTLTGTAKVSEKDFTFLDEIAPACVWTEYQRVTPE